MTTTETYLTVTAPTGEFWRLPIDTSTDTEDGDDALEEFCMTQDALAGLPEASIDDDREVGFVEWFRDNAPAGWSVKHSLEGEG